MKSHRLLFLTLVMLALCGSAYAGASPDHPGDQGGGIWGKFMHLINGLPLPHPSPVANSSPQVPRMPQARSPQAPLPSTCASRGNQRVAVIVASYPGAATPMASLDYLRELFTGTPDAPAPSLKDYYSSVSEGKLSLDRIDLYGPYMLPATYSLDPAHADTNGGSLDKYEQALLDEAQKDVHIDQYDRLVFVAPAILNSQTGQPYAMAAGLSSTDCAGVFSDGRVSKSMGVSWILSDPRYDGIDPSQIASPGIWNDWTPEQREEAIEKRKITDMAPLIHELGHTFGLGHANGIQDSSDTLPDEKTPMSCVFYDDLYDVMASSVTAPFDIPHRDDLGWLSNAELQTVTSSGTYRLYPSDTDNPGLKGLEIPRVKFAGDSTQGKIWVEYRVGTNLYEKGGVGLSAAYDGAIVHYTDPNQVYTAYDFHWPNETLILDFAPGAPVVGINRNLVLRGSWKDRHSLVGLDVLDITPQYMDIRVDIEGR